MALPLLQAKNEFHILLQEKLELLRIIQMPGLLVSHRNLLEEFGLGLMITGLNLRDGMARVLGHLYLSGQCLWNQHIKN